MLKTITYKPAGTCSSNITVEIEDGKIFSVKFDGGCPGSLAGLCKLMKGMSVEDVLERLEGLTCGGKGTSCPDQLAKALQEYLNNPE